MEPIRISYFSDVLCVWAYIAQIRIDELKSTFQERVSIDLHFTPVFGDAHRKLENRWRDRGGFQGYSHHVKEVAAKFDHVSIHPEIWTTDIPYSSTSRLNGNVGYRVIEANIRELLHNPASEQSWC